MAETAIAIAVAEAEALAGGRRRRHTAHGAEGMPAHVTLLYPFVDADALDRRGAVDEAAAVLARFPAFDVEFARVGRFPGAGATVLWLALEPSGPFLAMTAALAARFPERPPYAGAFAAIVPHLTVALSPDLDLLDDLERRMAPGLPIHARVGAAGLFEHGLGGWARRATFPLRG
jgi:2'-5' RNA ligase